jgi:hypothetical protein
MDGRSNLDEFVSGTDARNAASFLKIEVTKSDAGQPIAVLIRFMAVAGKTYSIQYLDSVTGKVWQKHSDVLARTETRRIDVPVQPAPAQQGRYFRVVTPAQP